MDSLLSIVQMPAGVPVGTLAIGKAGAINAALLAAAILATERRGAGRAARRLARGADRRRRRTARLTDDRCRPARPSASSAAASSAGCWPSPPRSSAIAATSTTRTKRRARPRSRRGFTRGAFDDGAALAAFAAACDVVTYEFENLPTAPLDALGDKLRPRDAQPDRRPGPRGRKALPRRRRRCASRRGPTVDDAADRSTPRSTRSACRCCSRPGASAMTARARRGSATPARRAAAWDAIGGRPAVAEAAMHFAAEFSVMVARAADGDSAVWPVSRNIHDGGILRRSRSRRARRSRRRSREATRIARAHRRRARPCRRADRRILRLRRRPGGQRDRAARPQQRPLDDRGRGDLAVRAAYPRDLRPAAARHGAGRAARDDGQSDRRRRRRTGPRWSPSRAPTSISTARARPAPAARWATSRG